MLLGQISMPNFGSLGLHAFRERVGRDGCGSSLASLLPAGPADLAPRMAPRRGALPGNLCWEQGTNRIFLGGWVDQAEPSEEITFWREGHFLWVCRRERDRGEEQATYHPYISGRTNSADLWKISRSNHNTGLAKMRFFYFVDSLM